MGSSLEDRARQGQRGQEPEAGKTQMLVSSGIKSRTLLGLARILVCNLIQPSMSGTLVPSRVESMGLTLFGIHVPDDTVCNLASINLLKYYDLDTISFKSRISSTALGLDGDLETSVLMAQFPSEEIARSYDYRTLGLGYCNIGSL